MKKSFFGYKTSDVETTLNSLREENEHLNSTIATLNAQLKNGDGNSAKVSLLESTIEQNQQVMKEYQVTIEKNQVTIETLDKDTLELKNKLITYENDISQLNHKLNSYVDEVSQSNYKVKSFEESQQSLEEELNKRTKLLDEREIELELLEKNLQLTKEYMVPEYHQTVAVTEVILEDLTDLIDSNNVTHDYTTATNSNTNHVSMDENELHRSEAIKTHSVKEMITEDTNTYLEVIENLKKDLSMEKTKKEALYLTLTGQVQELTAVTLELSSIKDRNAELEDAKHKIILQQNELTSLQTKIIQYEENIQVLNKTIVELESSLLDYNKMKQLETKFETQHALASDISLSAFNEMSDLQNVVAESIQSLLNEYHKHIIHNNELVRKEIEQYQKDYRNMLHSFISKASEFPIALSTLESKYSSASKFDMDVDSIYQHMNKTITRFMDETTIMLNKE